MYVYYIHIHICTYFDSVSSRHIQNLHYNAYGKTDVFCSISEMSTISRIFLDQQAVFLGFISTWFPLHVIWNFQGGYPSSSKVPVEISPETTKKDVHSPAAQRYAGKHWKIGWHPWTPGNPREPQGSGKPQELLNFNCSLCWCSSQTSLIEDIIMWLWLLQKRVCVFSVRGPGIRSTHSWQSMFQPPSAYGNRSMGFFIIQSDVGDCIQAPEAARCGTSGHETKSGECFDQQKTDRFYWILSNKHELNQRVGGIFEGIWGDFNLQKMGHFSLDFNQQQSRYRPINGLAPPVIKVEMEKSPRND